MKESTNPLRNAERGGGDVRDLEVVEDVGVRSEAESRKQSNVGQRNQSQQREPGSSHESLSLCVCISLCVYVNERRICEIWWRSFTLSGREIEAGFLSV